MKSLLFTLGVSIGSLTTVYFADNYYKKEIDKLNKEHNNLQLQKEIKEYEWRSKLFNEVK